MGLQKNMESIIFGAAKILAVKPKKRWSSLVVFILLFSYSCKKENVNTNDQSDAQINKLKTEWTNEGFIFHARLYTQEKIRWDEFFLTPIDVRNANGAVKCAYIDKVGTYSQQGTNYVSTLHYGAIENNRFVKSNATTCADLDDQNSDYTKFFYYDIDATGRLFTAYCYYQTSSSIIGMYQTYCTSDGINLGSEYFGYKANWRQSKGIVTGVSAFYNGLEVPQLRYLTVQAGVVNSTTLTPAATQIQDANYIATDGGNAFLCYTSLNNGGEMHLMGNDGAVWVNLGKVSLNGITGTNGVSRVLCVRNAEEPYFILVRDNNTIAVTKFNGVSIELVADNVNMQTGSVNFVANNGTFCVYQNKLMAVGNTAAGEGNAKTIFQLSGGVFTPLKSLTFSNTYFRGLYSDNQKLYATVEVFTADNGSFRSPIDIIELQ